MVWKMRKTQRIIRLNAKFIAKRKSIGWSVNKCRTQTERTLWISFWMANQIELWMWIMQFGAVCARRRIRVTYAVLHNQWNHQKIIGYPRDTWLSINRYCLEFIARAYGNKEKSNPKHSTAANIKKEKSREWNEKPLIRKCKQHKVWVYRELAFLFPSDFFFLCCFFRSLFVYIGKCYYFSPNTFNANYRL